MHGKVWSAEELEALTPQERDALFSASVVNDLADVPSALQPLLDRVRTRIQARIAGREVPEAR